MDARAGQGLIALVAALLKPPGPLPDNIPNLNLQVFVGSQQAQVIYAGRFCRLCRLLIRIPASRKVLST